MKQPIDFDKWLYLVRGILLENKWIENDTELDKTSWKQLYDEGLSAGRAVAINMGCEGMFCLN